MRDFVGDMKRLELGDYPGIAQVYLVIFNADYNREECSKQYIYQRVNIEYGLLQRYLDYLVDEKYVHRDKGNKYSTLAFNVSRAGAEKLTKEFSMTGLEKEQATALLSEIARRQTKPATVYTDIERFLKRFRSFLSIKQPSDVVEILRVINQDLNNVSLKELDPIRIKSALSNRHVAEQSVVRDAVNETTRTAQRTARFVRQYLKQNPELVKRGKVKRSAVKEFLGAHWSRYPEDTVPFELVEYELRNLSTGPIILGD